MKAALTTPICDLLGIRYPIIQTGMGWVAGARLTAATSAAGGLGILASATMTLEELQASIRDVKGEEASAPFGVEPPIRPARCPKQRVDLSIGEEGEGRQLRPGARHRDVIKRLKAGSRRGDDAMTIGAKRHAEKVAEWGVDAVIAQGRRRGGHTGGHPDVPLAASGRERGEDS